MLPIVSLLASSDSLAFLPQQLVETPMFKDVLQEIPVDEELQGPDIVLIARKAVPLTPVAEKLATLFQRA